MTSSKCLPVLHNFLFHYSLKTGTIFTGWLALGSAVLQLLIIVAFILVYSRQIPDWEFLLVSSVGGTLVSASVYGFLLYGTYKDKPFFLVPYLILDALYIVFGSLIIIGSGVYIFIYSPALGASIFVIGGLLVGFVAYLWLVVYSYYQQFKECSFPQHKGTVETVLTMAKNEDYMPHYKLLPQGNVV